MKPIVVATLVPPRIAHMLAPLPRCATTVRPAAARGVDPRQQRRRCTRRTGRESRSGARLRRRSGAAGRTPARRRLRAVERRVEARDLRQSPAPLRRPPRSPRGCAAGAAAPAGSAPRARRASRASTSTGPVKRAPPWTTRWPTAAMRCAGEHAVAGPRSRRNSIAPSWPRRVPAAHSFSPDDRRRRAREKRGCVSSSSIWPRSSSCGGSSSRKTENFRLDEPALRTSSAASATCRARTPQYGQVQSAISGRSVPCSCA